jgi:hypothetical protein
MFNNSTTTQSATMKKAPESETEQSWVGFLCKECGAPLSVHRSNNGSRPGERSPARLAHHLHQLRGARLLRARQRDGQNRRHVTRP